MSRFIKRPLLVPLAFPIIAGAGSMTTILSLRAEYASLNITIAILNEYNTGLRST